jgi:S-adenosylmethionine/arginine decarboxylase-like enzyme
MIGNDNISVIQGPHCFVDMKISEVTASNINSDFAMDLVEELAKALNMKRLGSPRVIRGKEDGKLSIYQIVATSHIIIHFDDEYVNADLFSCEPFNVDKCVSVLNNRLGNDAIIQYCQRNIIKAPAGAYTIPMGELNKLTSNSNTFTHALINWYGGKESLLNDIEHGTNILKYALDYLNNKENLPPSNVMLVDVEPIPGSWDKGGFSGGYINLMKQLTIHTFAGINGAYTDIMAHTFDLEKILDIIKEGFKFKYYEVDGIVQRLTSF